LAKDSHLMPMVSHISTKIKVTEIHSVTFLLIKGSIIFGVADEATPFFMA